MKTMAIWKDVILSNSNPGLALEKVAKSITVLGYFILSKNHNELSKVARVAKSGRPASVSSCKVAQTTRNKPWQILRRILHSQIETDNLFNSLHQPAFTAEHARPSKFSHTTSFTYTMMLCTSMHALACMAQLTSLIEITESNREIIHALDQMTSAQCLKLGIWFFTFQCHALQSMHLHALLSLLYL